MIRAAGTRVRCGGVSRRPPDAGVLRQRADQLRPRTVPARARRARTRAAAAAERLGRRPSDRRTFHRVRVQDPGEHGSAASRSRGLRARLFRPVHEGHGGVEPAASAGRIRASRAYRFFGRDRETITVAYAGDIIGLVNPGQFAIGDTLHAGAPVRFLDLPRFPAEHFGRVRLQDTRYKQFDEGLRQLEEEGLMQVFYVAAGRREPLVGVVGALQFDVITSRLRTEYGVVAEVEATPYAVGPLARRRDPAAALARWTDDPGRRPASAPCAALWLGVGAAVLRAPASEHIASGGIAGRGSDIPAVRRGVVKNQAR